MAQCVLLLIDSAYERTGCYAWTNQSVEFRYDVEELILKYHIQYNLLINRNSVQQCADN